MGVRTLLASCLALVLLSGCVGSELRRVTIDLEEIRAWRGQTDEAAADSLLPARVNLRASITDFDSVVGIEEFSLFIQLQNIEASGAVSVQLYAHREIVTEREDLIATGVAVSEPVFVHRESAVQIDARSYPALAAGFNQVREMALEGGFYLYLIGDTSVYHVVGNVPSASFLVTID